MKAKKGKSHNLADTTIKYSFSKKNWSPKGKSNNVEV